MRIIITSQFYVCMWQLVVLGSTQSGSNSLIEAVLWFLHNFPCFRIDTHYYLYLWKTGNPFLEITEASSLSYFPIIGAKFPTFLT